MPQRTETVVGRDEGCETNLEATQDRDGCGKGLRVRNTRGKTTPPRETHSDVSADPRIGYHYRRLLPATLIPSHLGSSANDVSNRTSHARRRDNTDLSESGSEGPLKGNRQELHWL